MARYRVEFTVDVLQGKQRPKFGGGHVHTPKATKEAEEQIATAYKGASIRAHGRVVFAPQYVPVAMQVDCYPEYTKSWRRCLPAWLRDRLPFTKTPDWDNLGKCVSDGLNGVAYHDDAQVIAAHVYKHDMEKGVHGHMRVVVEFFTEGQTSCP